MDLYTLIIGAGRKSNCNAHAGQHETKRVTAIKATNYGAPLVRTTIVKYEIAESKRRKAVAIKDTGWNTTIDGRSQ